MFLNQRTFIFLLIIIVAIGGIGTAEASSYRSYVFGTYEIIVFSYEDGTDFEVKGFGQTLWSGTLNKGQHQLVQKPYGYLVPEVYEVSGSGKFSVLTGDLTNGLSGYYAIDQHGRGASNELYTYVQARSGDPHDKQKFVVFAYEDGTQVTIEKDEGNGSYTSVVTNHPLDAGEHWESEDFSNEYIHVSSNKPASALTCYDMGYFVPSANGSFSGTQFYTYIAKNWENITGYSPQDLIVIAYDNDTEVTIADCNEPAGVRWQGAKVSVYTNV
jgi:hypothetical protein